MRWNSGISSGIRSKWRIQSSSKAFLESWSNSSYFLIWHHFRGSPSLTQLPEVAYAAAVCSRSWSSGDVSCNVFPLLPFIDWWEGELEVKTTLEHEQPFSKRMQRIAFRVCNFIRSCAIDIKLSSLWRFLLEIYMVESRGKQHNCFPLRQKRLFFEPTRDAKRSLF